MFAAIFALASSMLTVNVFYAGSLVTPMERAIAPALLKTGITFHGRPGGSKFLEHLIASKLARPDVFISVDPALVTALGDRAADVRTFASTSLGIGWSSHSRFAPLFARVAAGRVSVLDALRTPGLRIGRTDPRLDPKGRYTVEAMRMLAGPAEARAILGGAENPMQTFPEEDLLARIDTGEADVGFFYKTEAVARGLHFVPLPGKASMSGKITYTIAVLRDAPDPRAARRFERFIVSGQGRAILARAGLVYR